MSELIQKHDNRPTIRWKLLTSASALALMVSSIGVARAEDTDKPHVWIELGGQVEWLNAGEAQFAPPHILATPRPGPETIPPLTVPHSPRYSIGGDAKITVEPAGTDWVLSASVRYGRSGSNQHVRQQSYPTQPLIPPTASGNGALWQKAFQFIDTQAHHSETHAVLDFQAGKDAGLGMFGTGSSSVFSLGVRFAQFGSKSNVAFKSDPDWHPTFKYLPNGLKFLKGVYYHSNSATAVATRSFRGVGPSISWNASAPIVGNSNEGEINLDWGLNAALLFGRQKAFVHHQTTSLYHQGKYNVDYPRTTLYRHTPPDQTRSRFVTVPNIGGFAGATWRVKEFRMSLGYRADLFFGAMDGGIDAAKKENVGFYGPFASVSVGLGG